jgi:hypothetical protein
MRTRQDRRFIVGSRAKPISTCTLTKCTTDEFLHHQRLILTCLSCLGQGGPAWPTCLKTCVCSSTSTFAIFSHSTQCVLRNRASTQQQDPALTRSSAKTSWSTGSLSIYV